MPTDTGATATLGVPGMFGTAISFPGLAADGDTDCVSVPMSAAFYGMSDLTISAWVNVASAVGQMGVVSMWNEDGGTNKSVYYLGMAKGGPVTTWWGAYAGTTTGVQNTVRSFDGRLRSPRQLAPGDRDVRWKLARLGRPGFALH